MSRSLPVSLPDPVRPRDPVRARDFNALLAVVRSLSSLRVGDGLTLLRSAGGLQIGLAGAAVAEELIGVIDGVTAGAGDGAVPFLPSDVRYHARVIGRPEIEPLVAVLPVYGRPVAGDEFAVYPAKIGDACKVIVRPAPDNGGGRIAELWVLSEKLAGGCAAAT